ncbi:hypothetical protein [Ekhidna sp.]|uniref:hypothetical protein n=1 Tax=Ekhidna sp. TaxID=2608089 RepID=UPI003B513ECE
MSNLPNREEQLIIECLHHQGFEKIQFEPDGNVPPDLLINDQIAIEVRRLNQNQITENGHRGLEQEDYRIKTIINTALIDASDTNFESSALVSYSFKRPIPETKVLRKEIRTILEKHKSFISESRTYHIEDFFEMNINPSTIKLDKQFELLVSSDRDSGGFVVGLIYQNLKLIIEEKEIKTKEFKSNYPTWWLAVVDTIGYGLNDLDVKQFHELPKLAYQFDRILLVSPLDKTQFTYLYE